MLIKEPDPKTKILDDLEFVLDNGIIHPITLDKSMGDDIDWNNHKDAIVVTLASKPSLTELGEPSRPETHTVFKSKILYIIHRTREVTERTQAQHEQWMKTLQEAGRGETIN